MKKPRPLQLAVLGTLVLAGVAAGIAGSRASSRHADDAAGAESGGTALISKGRLSVWSIYPGRYESRQSLSIGSTLSRPAELSYLVAEGIPVRKGEVIARFEVREFEQERVRLEVARTQAEIALQELQKVTVPTEQSSLELELLESRGDLAKERKYLEDSERLVKDGLLSPQELEDQRRKLAKQEAKNAALEQKKKLTAEFSHPAQLQEARAKVQAARSAEGAARLQLEHAQIKAAADGVVLFHPTNIGFDYRVAHVGDSIAPNQAFMVLTDLANLVVNCEVPEGEISRVEAGDAVVIRSLAYPDLEQQGRVEHIGAIAQNASGFPIWQKFFHVVVALDAPETRARPGTSAMVSVLSYENAAAVLVPRPAVRVDDSGAFVDVRRTLGWDRRPLKLGKADSTNYEVLEGLAPGEVVRVP